MLEKHISFSFLVITYNHELYVIEHLESIKYQIEMYGKDYIIDILINDDCSSDKTVELIQKWVSLNANLFNRVVVQPNIFNKGTCSSVISLLSLIKTKLFKLTAGDDIYSYENIFEAALTSDNYAIISGYPLFIEEGILKEKLFSNYMMIATEIIYAKSSILKQFTYFSYNNAPNMFYTLDCVRDQRVVDFIQNFDVTEDWPMQIAISSYFPEKKIKYIKKVLVYYRRTSGSTYIVANTRFFNDKLNIFNYLIQNAKSKFSKYRIENRLYAFKKSNKIFSRFINIDLYIFLLKSSLNLIKICINMFTLDLNKNKHFRHYNFIKSKAIIHNQNF